MIAYLRGKILKKAAKVIILDTGNIGYSVHLTNRNLEELSEGQDSQFFIHSQIREDAFDLYGFQNEQDMNFFKMLLNINGIGPKLALEILNVPQEKVKSAIINDDSNYLTKIPGIGGKTAKRIILELKNKVEISDMDVTAKSKDIDHDTIEALTRLGYHRHQVIRTLKTMPEEIVETEEIVTYFLKNN